MPNIVRPGRTPLPGQSATGFKPNPWNVQKRYIAPEWGWAWENPVIMAPFWDGGSAVKPVGLQSVQSDGTLTGGISRSSGRYGRDLLIDNDSNPGFVDWGDAFSFSTTIPWTAVVLFRIEEIGTDERSWWCKYPADGGNLGRQLRWCVDTDGSIEFDMNNFTEIDLAPSGIVTAGEWFMGMIRCDPDADEGTQAFWDANGSRLYSGTGALPNDASDNTKAVTLGSRADGGDNFLGDIAMGAVWGETLSLSTMDRLAHDPFGPFRPAQQIIVSVPSGADVTLTADSGTYSVTGSNADLLRDLLITGESGSYSVTGSDADLLRSLLMSGDAGTYSVTGSDADLLRALQMTADAGSYSVTGQTADLLRALLLDAESGTYTVTGSAADLIVSGAITMTADAGSYSISGADADLLRDLQFTAESGSYTVTGQPADLLRALLIAAEAGGYNVTGQDADVLLDRILSADAGTYSLSGQDADLVLSAAFKALNIAVSVDQPLDLSASVDQPLDMDADVDQPLDMDVDVEPQE